MATLRDLLFGYGDSVPIEPGEFTVLNTNYQTAGNGGCCYLWSVPSGVTRAVFEMWSGGGSGAGGCCCMAGGGAGSGGYSIRSACVVPGQEIQICAAGSGCCGDYYTSISGCPSWVCSTGGAGGATWLSCLTGGLTNGRCVTCNYWQSCYTCCSMCSGCGGTNNCADLTICGTTGTGFGTQYCAGAYHQYSANGPMQASPRKAPNGCCSFGGASGWGIFPGGGGWSAQQGSSGGCCYGGPGAGGQVYVLYY